MDALRRRIFMLLLVLSFLLGLTQAILPGMKQYRMREKRSENSTTILRELKSEQRNEFFFDQMLDHASSADDRDWSQRYFKVEDYYEEGGPALIYIGGEYPQSASNLRDSHVNELARELKGKAFLLEHRFYGASHPTEDLSVPNLRWLTADQALGDLAYFIEYLRKQREISESSKVVVYGCSYAGNLAAWARLKYPHLVHAAVASSAPLRAQAEFPEYLQEISKVLRKFGGETCLEKIKEAFVHLNTMLSTPEGLQKVKMFFRVCEPFGTPEDKEYFLMSVSTPFQTLVNSFVNSDSNQTSAVQETCFFITSDSIPNNPESLVLKLAILNGGMATECFDQSYSGRIAFQQNLTWNDDVNDDDDEADSRQWLYQTCTEFGYFETMNQDDFGARRFPFCMAEKMCSDAFGPRFNADAIKAAVNKTNREFGGDRPDLNRVVFVHGDVDPWRVLGVNQSLHELAPLVLIKDGHHCHDIAGPSDSDPDSVRAAREEIKRQLRKILAT